MEGAAPTDSAYLQGFIFEISQQDISNPDEPVLSVSYATCVARGGVVIWLTPPRKAQVAIKKVQHIPWRMTAPRLAFENTVIAACDVYRCAALGCRDFHDNCSDNLHAALGKINLLAPDCPALTCH